MIELKDSCTYFLVLTIIIKHYKTILVVEIVVRLKDSLQQIHSIVCYISSE